MYHTRLDGVDQIGRNRHPLLLAEVRMASYDTYEALGSPSAICWCSIRRQPVRMSLERLSFVRRADLVSKALDDKSKH